MRDDDAQFEQDLRGGLKRLAEQAPAGAGVEAVRRRLRRRAMRRTLAGAGVAACAVALAAVWLVPVERGVQPMTPQIAQSPVRPESLASDTVEAALPEPIPVDAAPQQIQAAVFGYLSSVGVQGQVVICKEPGETLYYVVNGNVPIRPEQLHDHLAAMLRGFETIRIERRGRDVRCMLVADGQDGWQQRKEHV
jgi:hypothetical protein